jgi:voltage-gated potassium channel
VIGLIAGLVLVVLVALLIQLRFARALIRSLADSEFRVLFALVVLTLAAGTGFYAWAEEWSVLDAFYFSAITLTTVGYGDLTPSTAAGKLFTVFYIFAGIGIILAFVNAVAKTSVEQRKVTRGSRRRGSGAWEREDE